MYHDQDCTDQTVHNNWWTDKLIDCHVAWDMQWINLSGGKMTGNAMVPLLDGNSEHCVHGYRKIGLFWKKRISLFYCSRSKHIH